MIYAVPNNRDNVANHFMKATKFSFINEDNSLIRNIVNPATGDSSCSQKSTAIKMLTEMQADAVIVRNIGQRALGKLLASGVRVFMLTSKTPISSAATSPMTELTEANQGRSSHRHLKKEGCTHKHQNGDSCCSSEDNGGHSHCGCSHKHSHQHYGRSTLNDVTLLKHITNNKSGGKKRAMRFSLSGISSLRSINK